MESSLFRRTATCSTTHRNLASVCWCRITRSRTGASPQSSTRFGSDSVIQRFRSNFRLRTGTERSSCPRACSTTARRFELRPESPTPVPPFGVFPRLGNSVKPAMPAVALLSCGALVGGVVGLYMALPPSTVECGDECGARALVFALRCALASGIVLAIAARLLAKVRHREPTR